MDDPTILEYLPAFNASAWNKQASSVNHFGNPFNVGNVLGVKSDYDAFRAVMGDLLGKNGAMPIWASEDVQINKFLQNKNFEAAKQRFMDIQSGNASPEFYNNQSSLFGEGGLLSGDTLKGIASIGQAIGSVMGAWNANKAYGLAKDQFNFQKDFATKNLANQIASYNTALTDRMQARAAMETGNKDAYNDLINQRKLV